MRGGFCALLLMFHVMIYASHFFNLTYRLEAKHWASVIRSHVEQSVLIISWQLIALSKMSWLDRRLRHLLSRRLLRRSKEHIIQRCYHRSMTARSDDAEHATTTNLTATSLPTSAGACFYEGSCQLVNSGGVTIGENFKERSEELRKRRRSIQRAELREAQKQKRKRQQPEHEIIQTIHTCMSTQISLLTLRSDGPFIKHNMAIGTREMDSPLAKYQFPLATGQKLTAIALLTSYRSEIDCYCLAVSEDICDVIRRSQNLCQFTISKLT